MEIIKLCPGAFYIQLGEENILAGCPPEVVKILLQKNLPPPDIILVPDRPINMGESQISIEFPLYHHLFFRYGGSPKKRLKLIGNDHRLLAACQLVDLTLFGPDSDQLEEWGLKKADAHQIFKETSHFHLKDKKGKRLAVDALIETQAVIEDQPLKLKLNNEEIRITRVALNEFSIETKNDKGIIDLNFDERQIPPYPVNVDLIPADLVKFGIQILGGSTGFSATQASSGTILCYNGNFILLDAIPFMNHHLVARGVARNQIDSIFLSHIHDDHCNLISLLHYNQCVNVLTHEVIFKMMLKKLSLVMDRSIESLRSYFNFIPLEPGKETNYYGLKINPFWSVHSIPTIGAVFEASHSGQSYTMTFTADIQSLDDIKTMHKKGVLPKKRLDDITSLYTSETNLLLADGGEGVIHGTPADALQSPAERVVFMHLNELSAEYMAHFNAAESGKRYTIVQGDTDYNLTRTIEFLLEYFPDMPAQWISNLLGDQSYIKYNSGDIVIREGTQSQGSVYMIITGYGNVIQHQAGGNQVLTTVEAGELIGEMSAFSGHGKRNASVVALSPMTVTQFSEQTFLDFIEHQGYEDTLKTLWKFRQALQFFPAMQNLPPKVLRRVASRAQEYEWSKDVKIGKDLAIGSLFFPTKDLILGDGEKVKKHSRPIYISKSSGLKSGTGATGLLLEQEQAQKLCRNIPVFRFEWEERLGFPSFFET